MCQILFLLFSVCVMLMHCNKKFLIKIIKSMQFCCIYMGAVFTYTGAYSAWCGFSASYASKPLS